MQDNYQNKQKNIMNHDQYGRHAQHTLSMNTFKKTYQWGRIKLSSNHTFYLRDA